MIFPGESRHKQEDRRTSSTNNNESVAEKLLTWVQTSLILLLIGWPFYLLVDIFFIKDVTGDISDVMIENNVSHYDSSYRVKKGFFILVRYRIQVHHGVPDIKISAFMMEEDNKTKAKGSRPSYRNGSGTAVVSGYARCDGNWDDVVLFFPNDGLKNTHARNMTVDVYIKDKEGNTLAKKECCPFYYNGTE